MIKSAKEIEKMKIAGQLAAETIEMIDEYVKEGISTGELDDICHDFIVNEIKCIPACLNYKGYPKTICTSINQVICHGIPDHKKILKNGDIMNIDVTVIKEGYHGDTSKMYFIGDKKPHAEKLVKITQESMYKGIEIVKPGVKLGDIGYAIQKYAEDNHYSVVRDYCGHGIGANFHEDPQVLHYGQPNTGITLEEGMCFTIEPMLNLGSHKTKLSKKDGWTVETIDGRLSAQWEHTILVTSKGYEILTKRSDENFNQ
jgi:methionyl aminopeptidase